MTTNERILVSIAIVFAVLRVWIGMTISPEPMTWVAVYKDFAHIFIGILGTTWYLYRDVYTADIAWMLFWALVGVEVTVAVASRLCG